MRLVQALALCSTLGCATAEQVKVLQQKVDQLEMESAQLQQQPKILIQGEAIEGEINVPPERVATKRPPRNSSNKSIP